MALFGTLYTKKQAFQLFKEDEQTTINAKNRRIKSLELENNTLNDKVIELVNTLRTTNLGTREDKLIALAEKFIPSMLLNSHPPKKLDSADRKYSDEEIQSILKRVKNAGQLSNIMAQSQEDFIIFVKQKIPEATTNDALKAYETGKEMLNNGHNIEDKTESSREESSENTE